MAAASLTWHKCLDKIPDFTCSMLEDYLEKEKAVRVTSQRGYKFFLEGFIHEVEVCDENSTKWAIRSKCYHSQKRSSLPHNVKVDFCNTQIEGTRCSCAAGKSMCHHTIALLYQLQHYKKLNLKTVPPLMSQTSLPQTWHIPSRQDGITPKAVPSMTVQQSRRHNKSLDGVTSALYNPVQQPLHEISINKAMMPFLSSLSPTPQYSQLWSGDTQYPLVNTKFGQVPKGSLLSYHLKEQSNVQIDIINIEGVEKPPVFPRPVLALSSCVFPLNYKSHSLFWGLEVTQVQSVEIDAQTKSQSESKKWHHLHEHRITSSNFKRVCCRRDNFESLVNNLTNKKFIQTAKMKFGLENEPVAAGQYASLFGRNVYSVGFVINPSAFHLGCSPDRRVYDAESEEPYGLLEIKCPSVHSISECKYLYQSNTHFKLKKNHEYYYQVMGQLGITGATWCDFFVKAESDFHCERIYIDNDFFTSMKNKLDFFYFTYFLPVSSNEELFQKDSNTRQSSTPCAPTISSIHTDHSYSKVEELVTSPHPD